MTTQDQNLAIVTGFGALVIGGAIAIGMSADTATPTAPTAVEATMETDGPSRGIETRAGSAAVEVRAEDMPASGQSEIDSPRVAPGATVTAQGQLPDEWSWGGHLVLAGDAFGKFSVGDVHVETRADGYRWIVVTATNASDAPARFDALFDYAASATPVDAGTD